MTLNHLFQKLSIPKSTSHTERLVTNPFTVWIPLSQAYKSILEITTDSHQHTESLQCPLTQLQLLGLYLTGTYGGQHPPVKQMNPSHVIKSMVKSPSFLKAVTIQKQ